MKNEGISDERIMEIASILRSNLSLLELPFERDEPLDRMPVDLADIYSICVKGKLLIEDMLAPENWTETPKLKAILRETKGSLYDHLEYHHASLGNSIDILLEKLAGPEDEELLDQLVEKANRKLSEIRNRNQP